MCSRLEVQVQRHVPLELGPIVADVHPHDYYPDWAPDGARITFFSGPDYDQFQVYTVDLASGEVTRVTSGPITASHPAWSPNGQRLLVVATIDGQTN